MTQSADDGGTRSPRLAELAPDLVDELRRGLAAEQRTDLIPQLEELLIERRCGCEQSDCATIYVSGGSSPLTDEQRGERGEYWRDTVVIDAEAGHIAIDTDRYDRISGIEILNHRDLHQKLGFPR